MPPLAAIRAGAVLAPSLDWRGMTAKVAALRARARQCREFAAKYAADIGPSLGQLAIELDKRADAIEARNQNAEADGVEGAAP